MEKFVCKQDCELGYFNDKVEKGQEFPVLRNIKNECVLIRAELNEPNIIVEAKQLRKYGTLSGTPQLGGS